MQQASLIEQVKTTAQYSKNIIARCVSRIRSILNNDTIIKVLLFAAIIALLTVAANLEAIM